MLHMKILIRSDDIAENMNWHLMNKCEALFDELNIKPVMGSFQITKTVNYFSYPKK